MIQPIDGALATTSYFAAPELAKRRSALLPRWADVHFDEIERDLPQIASLRSRYVDLAYRATLDTINQYEFDATEKIHNDEIAAGWYTIQSDVAAYENQSQALWAKATAEASNTISAAINTTILDWDLQDPERFATYKANVAYASMFSVYDKVHKENAAAGATSDWIWITGDLIEGPLIRPQVMTSEAGATHMNVHPVPDVIWNTVRAAALPETIYTFATINSQKILADGSAKSAEQMLGAKTLLTDWNRADIQFRRARTQLALDVNSMRRDARQSPRGPLNAIEQLTSLKEAFADRLADVYIRCGAISDGLKSVWGLSGLVDPPAVDSWHDDQGSFIDAIIAHVSMLRRELGTISALEGNAVIPLSVASLVGANAWSDTINAAIAAHAAVATFDFAIPQSALGSLKFQRVRGMAAYARGTTDEAAGTWRATIRPPAHAASDTGAGSMMQDAPTVDLSRIQTRENPKPPDVVGLASLRNIVPVTISGASDPSQMWRLTLATTSLRGVPASTLTDLELDLLVAGSMQ